MAERSDFEPPAAIFVHGEGLSRMDLDQYTQFVAFLGSQGLQVSVPTETGLGPAQGDSSIDSDVAGPRQIERNDRPKLLLMTADEIKQAAQKYGFTPNAISTGTSRIMSSSRYFPNTERAWERSRLFIGDRALAYYDHRLLTPEWVGKFMANGIDPEEGFDTFHAKSIDFDTPGRYLPNSFREIESVLKLHSRLDVISLEKFVKGTVFPEIRNVGDTIVRNYSLLCERILKDAGIETDTGENQ